MDQIYSITLNADAEINKQADIIGIMDNLKNILDDAVPGETEIDDCLVFFNFYDEFHSRERKTKKLAERIGELFQAN